MINIKENFVTCNNTFDSLEDAESFVMDYKNEFTSNNRLYEISKVVSRERVVKIIK